jgi:hypothetical protein
MTTIRFPSVIPSSMEFSPPEFPIGEDVSIGGVYTRRKFGNKPSEGRLQTEFNNISNSLAAEILGLHLQSKGLAAIIFDRSFFSGAGTELRMYLSNQAYPGLSWFFVKGSPPRIGRVEGGGQISNVSVEFAARLVVG